MAANLALGSQSAVCGAFPVYQHHQIRSNLVTKSHHITANPTVKPEARFLVSSNRIHSNSVTKRRQYQIKMMAEPTKGPGVFTQVHLFNNTDKNLIFKDSHDWNGFGNPPLVIRSNVGPVFEHNADPLTGGSAGGVAYAVADQYKWIVAWSNMKDQPNKVYTNIISLSEPVDWNNVKAKLSSGRVDASKITAYKSTFTINEMSPTPNLTATIDRVYE